MFFNKKDSSDVSEALLKEIIKDFGGACACCQVQETSEGEDSRLTIHHIDGNRQNDEKENLLALCLSCQEKIQQDALQYFDAAFEQPPLLAGYDYLTTMQRLRKTGLQQQQFKQLQEELKQALLGINKKKRKQLRLFETSKNACSSKEEQEALEHQEPPI